MTKFILALVVILLVGGAVFLATWEIPAPSEQIEKTIPNDRFER